MSLRAQCTVRRRSVVNKKIKYMKTKIIATIGPRSEDPKILEQLVVAGMDIARMNFSHCTYDEYRARKKNLERIGAKHKRAIAFMQDLCGPRLRVGSMPVRGRALTQGEQIVFSTERSKDRQVIFIDDEYLHNDISVGDPLYLANGEMELVVEKVVGRKIYARVLVGGVLFSRKAVNVPQTSLTTSGLTQKDIDDVAFAVAQGVDYIALSFVQSADDVKRLRSLIPSSIKIIAKIERAIAIKHIDEIIQAADAIMVARGDLGTELPLEEIPIIQKNIVRHAAWYDKGSIIATQMLVSMVDQNHPTRAEVSDVANAVWDGADAVMLSDETANGSFPVASLATMARIVERSERYHYSRPNRL